MKKNRPRLCEPEAVREIHRIRDRILRKARQAGIASYYLSLNERPELVLSTAKPEASVLGESRLPYRATAPEVQALREVHQWRAQIQEEMRRLGVQQYVQRLNERTTKLLSKPGAGRLASKVQRREQGGTR